MSKLAAPLIIAAHVATLPTLTGWDAANGRPAVRVVDGAMLRRDEVRRWCTVGYVHADEGPAVHLEPTHDAQSQNREAGSIAHELVVAAADVATARAAILDLLLPWSYWLQRPNYAAMGLLPGSALALVADVTLVTTRSGATASALVTTTYTAITYG